jgi:cell division GTPase FtsZ
VQFSSDRQLRVGLVGVVGVGVYHLDRVANNLNYPCKTIAIETNMARLHWCSAEHALLIGDHGFKPATIRDAQLMARDRKSDIARLVSGLDVAFILTGLNGTTGKGVTSVVAEALGELGVFTIAITPGSRGGEAVRSLQRLVDVVFEVPYDVLIDEARATRRSVWKELVPAAVAQICRVVTFSLAKSGPIGIDADKLRSVLRGDSASVVGYGNSDGVEGCLAAFEVASKCPQLGSGRVGASRGVLVFIEAKPGILQDKDTENIRSKMREISRDGAKLLISSFENEQLSADYRVTILSRVQV